MPFLFIYKSNLSCFFIQSMIISSNMKKINRKLLPLFFFGSLLILIAASKTTYQSSVQKDYEAISKVKSSYYFSRIKSSVGRREVLKETLRQSFYTYLSTGWNHKLSSNVDFNTYSSGHSHIELSVVLDAMNTFFMMNMHTEYHKARRYLVHHLHYASTTTPAPLELFPGLVTAYQLTGNKFFYNRALEITGDHDPRDKWPLETAALSPLVVRSQFFEKVEKDFESLFSEESFFENTKWKYYWMLGKFLYCFFIFKKAIIFYLSVNMHRFSNFTYTIPVSNFNFWLKYSNTGKFRSWLVPKVYTTNKKQSLDKGLVYIGLKEGSMVSADCAWGAIFSLVSQAVTDSMVIGGQITPVKIIWSDRKLLSTGLNITETCRLAAATSPFNLPLSKFTFNKAANNGNDDFEKKDANESAANSKSKFFTGNKKSNAKLEKFISSNGSYDLEFHLPLSYFINYRITRDEHYQEFAWVHFLAIEDHCHQLGINLYAPVKTTNGKENETNDQEMQNSVKTRAKVFFGQTMRYLYLTFEDTWKYPLSKYIFTADGSPLRFA